ncbi:MAG: sigma-54 dependent transcriptional regulator [Alphaproteobacteria bacterium]
MAHDILIVDDQEDIRQMLATILKDEGYQTRQASSGHEALDQLKLRRPHLVILDIWLDDSRLDGLKSLELIKQLHATVPVVMISGHGTIETAVCALKKGAYDFIEKPFKTERLLNVVRRGLELSQLQQEIQSLKQDTERVSDLTGHSPQISALKQAVERVSKTNSRIMIEGPAGVGKEIVARLVHKHSSRAQNPFVLVNCANLSPTRFEEELFGKETRIGSIETDLKLGLLEKADRGTLFLDGIHEMPLETQGKILQVLHDQKFYRVGGTKPIQVDIRFISSHNGSLAEKIKKETFREDLFYRLNVVPLIVPSLYQRRDDVMELANYFVKKFFSNNEKVKRYFAEDAKFLLETYSWPGNVRQMRNIVEWLSIMHPEAEAITLKMLPTELQGSEMPQQDASVMSSSFIALPIKQAREEFEKNYLDLHIKRFNGNISKTAQAVGMERTALHRKIKMLNLPATEQ